jgi:hypothetical protein
MDRSMTNPAPGDSFAPQLFARHVTNEIIELDTRHVIAHALETVSEILSHRCFSAGSTLATEIARAPEGGGANSG